MKRFVYLPALFFASAVGNWWCASHFGGVGVMLLSAAAVSALYGPVTAQSFAFMGGLYLDFMAPKLFGGHALAFTLAAYLAWHLRQRMDMEGAISQMILAALMTVFTGAVYSVLELFSAGKPDFGGFPAIIFSPMINGLLAPAWFFVFSRARGRLPRHIMGGGSGTL